jgi:hypothetical protein
MFDRTSRLFAAVLLVALASFGSQPNPAQAAAPEHHAQAPGFYRMKVGDLEVTALFDGSAVFDLHWLTAKKPALDRVAGDLMEDPHLLDTSDAGFLVKALVDGMQLVSAPGSASPSRLPGDIVMDLYRSGDLSLMVKQAGAVLTDRVGA